MPGERLSMRKVRELLRLRWEQHLPQRVIGNSLRLSQGSVSEYLNRAPTPKRPAAKSLADWIGAHVKSLNAIGGVPRQIVSDNLKSGITKACFYEPTVNRTYADMAAHYRSAIIPARPYKPRDKAKVEVGVQVVQRWILARLRNRRFFSLGELNRAIRELVDQLNDRPMRGWGLRRPVRHDHRPAPP